MIKQIIGWCILISIISLFIGALYIMKGWLSIIIILISIAIAGLIALGISLVLD